MLAKLGLILFYFVLINIAKAEVIVGFDTAVSQDKKTITSSSSLNNLFLDGSVLVSFNQDSNYFLSLGYIYSTSTEPFTSTTSATFISSNPYAGLSYFAGKQHTFGLGVYWIPAGQGTYSQSSSLSESWSGSGFYTKLMVQPELTKYLSLSFSLIYYSATYSSKGSTASVSDVSTFSRTYYSPMVGLKIKF